MFMKYERFEYHEIIGGGGTITKIWKKINELVSEFLKIMKGIFNYT